MRGARWLLLVAMAAIIGAVSFTYRAQQKILRDQAPAKPAALPPELNSTSHNWRWTETDSKGCKTANIEADETREVKDSSRVELKNVGLKLYKKCSDDFDLVKSAAATFFSNEHRLYSEGDVEITLGVPAGEPDKPDLVSIRSSGVTFDSNSGRAETDRPSSFTFRNGDGRATGASYDPSTRELQMKKDVEVNWRSTRPNSDPMKIEAGELTYHEARSEILLPAWGKMTRGPTAVEGDGSILHLEDGVLRTVMTNRAHGTEDYPNRKLGYAADFLAMSFDENGQVQKIIGKGNAKLVAAADGSETTITAPTVVLDFVPGNGESELSQVATTGDGVVTAKPLPVAGRDLPETHILRSSNITIQMRPGGREIATLVTHAPGNIEFIPNLPTQHHRTLDGNDMVIAYGAQNRIETFHAKSVKTLTDPNADERRRNVAQSATASQELLAHFDAGSSRLATMEQSGAFTYRQGDRQARAAKATLDSDANVMVLDTGARVWDATGSTTADHIRLDQRTGNFTAEGRVRSSRQPDQDAKKGSSMLSGDEPVEAQANKMASSNRNRLIHYEGNVTLWQGANRIQASVIDVDREKQMLVADRNVVSNLWEQPKNDEKRSAAPVPAIVHAAHLVYTDENRLADYTGNVELDRPGLHVKSRELRAFLADSSAESRLEKAIAEGGVQIVQTIPGRTRTGTAEHAEYFPGDEKVILREGKPQLVDSLKGESHGIELTYFANDDRLQVVGSTDQPAKSQIRRK
ncbi:MAG TPA: LPS export ABC transporter periplasmic protein LptC [Bryobacteraceae bacterium]|nr:LPS export ABC transporter periplasmic protein LptC [Bryobacteraceae bacterium]